MTPAEKKRFTWVMILIVFFFANLIVGTILVLHIVWAKPVASPGAAPATTLAPASQP
jgi:hypothetical protein